MKSLNESFPSLWRELWEKVHAYNFGGAEREDHFSRRLARENCWSLEYAKRVVHEYMRFALLSMVAGHMVTPSDQVDQAWHLHLLQTQEYWQHFCSDILGKDLHHEPSQGGNAEDLKYDHWYTQTLVSYQKIFDEAPPVDIWPVNQERFGHHHVRIDLHEHLIVKAYDFPVLSSIFSFFLKLIKRFV